MKIYKKAVKAVKTTTTVTLKDGRDIDELSPTEAALVLARHSALGHDDYNPDRRTARAAAQIALPGLEKTFTKDIPIAREQARESIYKRVLQFQKAVKDVVEQNPGATTEWHVTTIMGRISNDDTAIAAAAKKGERWTEVDTKFPRKDLQGNPYSERSVRDEVRRIKISVEESLTK